MTAHAIQEAQTLIQRAAQAGHIRFNGQPHATPSRCAPLARSEAGPTKADWRDINRRLTKLEAMLAAFLDQSKAAAWKGGRRDHVEIMAKVLAIVADEFKVSAPLIMARCNRRPVADARNAAIAVVLKMFTDITHSEIAVFFDRDRSIIYNARRSTERGVTSSAALAQLVASVESRVNAEITGL